MGLQWIFVWCLEKYQFYLFIPLVLTIILGMQWIKVYADYGSWILWVTVQYHIWGQRAFSTRERLRACPHPKKFCKVEAFLVRFPRYSADKFNSLWLRRLSKVDLSGHLGESVCNGCTRLCPQSSFIYFSCGITATFKGFQNTVFGNESSRV